MINTLLGIKKNMSVRFDQYGRRLPVTLIEAEPNVVVLKKGDRVVLGIGKKKKVKKTENAYVLAAGYAPRIIKEIPIQSSQQVNTGDKITVSIFQPQDEVKVTGVTKGRGFAGVVKRWGFAGGPKTHGQSDRHRAPGSIGQTTTPGRVYKGKKMAGHMGVAKLTITGLEVIEVNPEKNLLVVKGSVPGARNGYLVIEKTGSLKAGSLKAPRSREGIATTETTDEETENTEQIN